MKTTIYEFLGAPACPNFEEWAEASNLPWVDQGESYILNKDDVMNCKVLSPYLIELRQAFADNPNFESITLDTW